MKVFGCSDDCARCSLRRLTVCQLTRESRGNDAPRKNANSRGKHIMLALRRIAHSEAYLDGPSATDQFCTILDNKLTVAPWEETD